MVSLDRYDSQPSPTSVMASIDQDGRKQQFDEEKLGLIRECLSQEPVSLWDLRELALSKGGLLNGKL
jgi:hypothetical protein